MDGVDDAFLLRIGGLDDAGGLDLAIGQRAVELTGDVGRDVPQRLGDRAAKIGDLVEAGGLVDLALELTAKPADRRHHLAEPAHDDRQILRADEDQRRNADQQHLAPTTTEHELDLRAPAGAG